MGARGPALSNERCLVRALEGAPCFVQDKDGM